MEARRTWGRKRSARLAVAGAGVGTGLVFLFALACGLSVANLYYLQPLLALVASELHSSASTTGLLVTTIQIGFGVGIVLLVPLGDLLDRRALVPTLLVACAGCLTASAFAPSISVLLVTSAGVGLTSVVAQALVPFAADLAADERRGQVVGTVMTGLLLGILLARTASGLLAAVIGWRGVEAAAAVVAIVMGLVLRAGLPRMDRPKPLESYREVLVSAWRLLGAEPVLRRRCAYGALLFAAFSVLWTNVAFLLSSPPYSYPDWVIGLFGLVGASGATASSLAGRLADRGHGRAVTGAMAVLLVGGFGLLSLGARDLVWLVLGMVVLDFGCFGLHIVNQHEIYRLREQARSRLTADYIGIYFVGGAVGSALSTLAWARYRWEGVCALGAFIGIIAVALWADELRRSHALRGSGASVSMP